MKIQIDLGPGRSTWLRKSRFFGIVIKALLDALVWVNLFYIKLHRVPALYNSGVRYQEEPEGQEESFDAIPAVLARGWGDCDDLAPWRVAELRAMGEKAKIRIEWKMNVRTGMKMFHIVVRRANGDIEDPSAILGMR